MGVSFSIGKGVVDFFKRERVERVVDEILYVLDILTAI